MRKKTSNFSGDILTSSGLKHSRGTICLSPNSDECEITSSKELEVGVSYDFQVITNKQFKTWLFQVEEEKRIVGRCCKYLAKIISGSSLNLH